MRVQVNYDYREDDVKALFDVELLVRSVVEREDVLEPGEVSVSFVTDEAIHSLNREYRGIDRPTDVLSFECDGADDGFDEESLAQVDSREGGEAIAIDEPFQLGDVIVAVDAAERQAPEYGMSFGDELSLLVVHGMLHLCGYDHMEDDEAAVMEEREREVLSEFWARPFKRHGFEEKL